jgi:hypothetical protein
MRTRPTRRFRLPALAAATVLALGLLLSLKGPAPVRSAPQEEPADTAIVALPGYHVRLFAKGTTAYLNPDPIVVDRGHVFVAFQNVTAKDGTDNKTSTIVEYDDHGRVLHTFSVLGHCDGLRVNPATHLLWATSNEDGNPRIVTIDPTTGAITPYVFPPTPHGGGYDDLAFLNGKAFIAASNPTLNSAGVNVFPAIDEVTLTNGQAVLTPILNGDATATDTTTNMQVTLNLTDPDSLSVDAQGNLVLVDQADAELVFLHNPGTAQQTVTRLPVGTQLDDTVWAPPAEARLFIVDGPANAIYQVDSDFTAGTVFTEAPSDSGVASFVGTLNPTTGTVTPIAIGFKSPTGLLFAAGTADSDR